MALYLTIQTYPQREDAAATRANYQAGVDCFTQWKPSDGIELLGLWTELTFQRAFVLWSADDPGRSLPPSPGSCRSVRSRSSPSPQGRT
jgi:hypothetical protein